MFRFSRAVAVPAAVAALLLAGCGRSDEPEPVAAPQRAAQAQAHGHGSSSTAAPTPAVAVKPSGVKAKKTYVDKGGNKFTIWVAFGPPTGGTGNMCTLEGPPAGYTHNVLLMVHSDARKRAPAPRLGARGGAVAWMLGDSACSWVHSSSDQHVFKPGETRTFAGLVRQVPNRDKASLVLTIDKAAKRRDWLRIPYSTF
jgi:hypothetical protein